MKGSSTHFVRRSLLLSFICLCVVLAGLVTIAGISLALRVEAAWAATAGGTSKPVARPDDCSFTTVPSANLAPYNTFASVASVAPNNAWAVGHYPDSANVERTLAEHWNGSEWAIVPSPNAGNSTISNYLYGVDAVSANDVWAVGTFYDSGSWTLTLHWDGALWNVVPSPNPGGHDNTLYAVTAVSANDVWAVGTYNNGTYGQTLVEHWDGTAWHIVSSPNPPSASSSLIGIAVLSATDVWSVGDSVQGFTTSQTLVEHWDGTAWSIVPSPNQGTSSNGLAGVDVVSADDVWAVGRYDIGNAYHTLIEHWDGTAWSIVPSPNVGADYNVLISVSEAGANDIWAVGIYVSSNNFSHPLIEHWNGSAWGIVPTSGPDPGSVYNELYSVAAAGPGDIWAVGIFANTTTGNETLAEHWNGTSWSRVQTPNPRVLNNELDGVVALPANDAWAVGAGTNPISNTLQPLTQHWDGSRWSIVDAPNPGGMAGHLKDVSALSANDVWAVGDAADGHQTLVEHWDGIAWSVLPSPNVGASYNILRGIAALSGSNIWAVGDYADNGPSATLVEHWDGTAWSVVTSPNPMGAASLSDVTVIASDNAWAVGYYNSNGADHAFAEHWDGAVWSLVPVVHPGSGPDTLFGVSAASAGDVWTVGFYVNSSNINQTLVEHWDGAAWSIVPSPSVGSDHNVLHGVSALAANDAWAVGLYVDGTDAPSLVEHWDGTVWSVVPSASVGPEMSNLLAVSVVDPSNVWAVGYANGLFTPTQTLAERYTCTSPSPTPTGSPVASPTSTPPVTPTTCTVLFHDVPAGSTFYPYVRCMACRGIINGYPCGGAVEPCNPSHDPYFRPNRNVTRGQIAKIVALSSGNHSPVSGQSFQDVPPGSTFYTYTDQLAALRVMSGYPCGRGMSEAEGEPCGPGNLPYFRPNSPATRAQLSKIDANAAGYSDTPTGRQFQDVLPGSTFYTFTYELVSRGVMSGYPCGGAGEPCGLGNLPYFRPQNNVTRGQTSKIVANTFFPDCSTPLRRGK